MLSSRKLTFFGCLGTNSVDGSGQILHMWTNHSLLAGWAHYMGLHMGRWLHYSDNHHRVCAGKTN